MVFVFACVPKLIFYLARISIAMMNETALCYHRQRPGPEQSENEDVFFEKPITFKSRKHHVEIKL